MKFFVDTAEISEIRELNALGLVDGVTTNPSLVKKSGRDFIEVVREILRRDRGAGQRRDRGARLRGHDGRGPQAGAARAEHRGQGAADLGRAQGLPRALRRGADGQRHALLLGEPGAARRQGRRHLHLAVRRPARRHQHRRHGPDPRDPHIYDNYGFETEILAASIRTVNHVKEAALIGADVITAPAGVLRKLADHPLTDNGLTAFLKDWSATGQTIV